MLASRAYSHFGELIGVRRRCEEVKLQAAQDRETGQAELQRERARATAAEEFVREWNLWMGRRADNAIELQKAQEEVKSLNDSLSDSTSKLAAAPDALAIASKRNGQLEQELIELPRVRADLAVAQL